MDDMRSKLLAELIWARESAAVLRELTVKQRRLVVDAAWELSKGREDAQVARMLVKRAVSELLGDEKTVPGPVPPDEPAAVQAIDLPW